MPRAAVVEIGSGDAADCSRRLLSAFDGGSLETVKRELARAERVSRRGVTGSGLADEHAELLGALVERMRVFPCGDAEIFLLEHLAGDS